MKNFILVILSIFIIVIFSCSIGGSSSSGGGGGSEETLSDDMLPPVIDRVELDPTPTTIDVSGTINIKVYIKDGYDNIDYVNVYLFSPRQLINNEGVRLWDWLDYNAGENCFEGSIDIETYHESGT